VKLSRVVLAEFAQLAPDRSVSVAFSGDRKTVTVAVFGAEPSETGVSAGLRTDPVPAVPRFPVVPSGPGPVRPAVSGSLVLPRPGVPAGAKADGRNEVEVTVERRAAGDQNDLSWVPEPDAKAVLDVKPPQVRTGQALLWSGTVTLPASGSSTAYRLVIKEYEVFYADASGAFLGKRIDRRLVYADVLGL
jgi:hypothetical protein